MKRTERTEGGEKHVLEFLHFCRFCPSGGAHNLPVCGKSDGAGEEGRWFIYAVCVRVC